MSLNTRELETKIDGYKMPKSVTRKCPKKQVVISLPKKICNDIILPCALKFDSTLSRGKSKRLKDQYKTIPKFYHRRPSNDPSQIKLLCDASYTYMR